MLWLERLPDDVNCKILSYLNGYSLVCLEKFGEYWAKAIERPELWLALDDRISPAAKSALSSPKARVVSHELAAGYCHFFGAEMRRHFDFQAPIVDMEAGTTGRGSLVWRGCTDGCDALHLNTEVFGERNEFDQFEFFLCLSCNGGIVWQGFVPAVWQDQNRLILRCERANAEIMTAWKGLSAMRHRLHADFRGRVHPVDPVMVTVLAVDRRRARPPSLVVATQFLQYTQTQKLVFSERSHRVQAEFRLADLNHDFGSLHVGLGQRVRQTTLKCNNAQGLYQIVITDYQPLADPWDDDFLVNNGENDERVLQPGIADD